MDNFAVTTKGLTSCEADLKVTVGRTSTSTSTSSTSDNIDDTHNEGSNNSSDEVVCFMYPKTLLANASEYVDTMLSVPMQEKETYTISFSDIRPESWFKWTNFVLHPVCACEMDPFDEDAVDMFLFYNKYQFRSGINLFDYKLSRGIKSIHDIEQVNNLCTKIIADMVVMISKDATIDLPLTKNVLPIFITKQFSVGGSLDCSKLSGDEIRTFLPYVFQDYSANENTHLEDMVDIVDGANINERSVEDLKLILFETSFTSALKKKLLENKQLEYDLQNLKVDGVFINFRGHGRITLRIIRGYYRLLRRPDKRLGVMQNWYCYADNVSDGFTYIVQSLDGLGSTWVISAQLGGICDKRCGFLGPGGGAATLLYKWHKGDNITSILPPKDGWEDIGVADFIRDELGNEPDYGSDFEVDNSDDDDNDDDENTGSLYIQYKINS